MEQNYESTVETPKREILPAFTSSLCFEQNRFYIKQCNYAYINTTAFYVGFYPENIEVSDEMVALFIVHPKKQAI